MLNFRERYFDGADPAAPAAPGRREFLAKSLARSCAGCADLAEVLRRPIVGPSAYKTAMRRLIQARPESSAREKSDLFLNDFFGVDGSS